MKKLLLSWYIVFVLFLSCSFFNNKTQIEYVIGVSQPNMRDSWRLVQIDELQKEALKYPNIRLVFTDATGKLDKQIDDIHRLVESGIDLLIVSPSNSSDLSSIITDVHKKIPVILLDQVIDNYNYSLFIGPDNFRIGKLAAETISAMVAPRTKSLGILEIAGNEKSITTKNRHAGFIQGLPHFCVVKQIYVEQETRDPAEDVLLAKPHILDNINVIFVHNDSMALGAWKAIQKLKFFDIKIIGVDGFSNETKGLELLKKDILNVDITCPTGGREAIQFAVDILGKKEGVPKQIILRSYTVTKNNIALHEIRGQKKIIKKQIRVGHAQIGEEGVWRAANKKSILKAAKDFNVKLVSIPAENTQESQIKIIQSFIKEKMDIIVLSPIVETGWEPILSECKRANIPVILSDRKIALEDDDLYLSFIGADFTEEGRRAMRWVVQNINPHKKNTWVNILEIQGTLGASPTIERKNGFEEILNKHLQYKIVASLAGDYTYKKSFNEVIKYFSNFKDAKIDVIFCHNDDMALAAADALEFLGIKPGIDIKLVSVDGIDPALKALKKGRLNCIVECNPLLGPQLMKAIKDYIAGKELPLRIITDEIIFTEKTPNFLFRNRKY